MREILLNICMTAIALCLFKMLVPENPMKKQTDFLVACFFLASMLFFFTSGKISFTFGEGFSLEQIERVEHIPFADFEEEYAKAQKRAIEREMNAALFRLLADEGITPEEIYTLISISDNISDKYSISINEIRLVFRAGQNASEGEGFENNDHQENPENAQDLEILKQAIHLVQKEVGDNILVTGELKSLKEQSFTPGRNGHSNE